MISLPFSAYFKQKLFHMKQFKAADIVNRDRLSSLFNKGIIIESFNLIKGVGADMKYKSINLQ